MTDISALKDRHRSTWAAGDYPQLADKLLEEVHRAVAEAAGPSEGEDVLDVATGAGHVAVLMAQSGANVTGLDLTPELIESAKQRSGDVEWVVGDAEDLPFDEDSFDVVTSSIGVQFAPRPEAVAAELARVMRPDGRLVLANWTKEGVLGRSFTLIAEYAPPPPAGVKGPPAWGDRDYLAQTFGEQGIELEFDERHVILPFEGGEGYVAYFEAVYGPTVMLKNALQPQGRWDEFRARYVETVDEFRDQGGVNQAYYLIRGRHSR